MSTSVAFLACLCFILWMFAKDVKSRPKASAALWIPLIWALIMASRPVSDWLGYSSEVTAASAYDAGNPLERNVYLLLMAASFVVLRRRRVSLGAVIRDNRWLFAFYLFWAFSVLWSDAPLIAFKRLFKDLGTVLMVLVILTEDDPVEAARNVFVRCSLVLVPLSLLFIRYIPQLGRTYDYEGNVMFVGVCPSKNTLGSLVLVGGLFLFWDLFNELHKEAGSRDRGSIFARIFLLVLILWVLRLSHCATALFCVLVGIGIFFSLRMPFVKRNLRFMEVYLVLGALIIVVLNSMFNLRGMLFQGLGRNESLTGRTELWDLLLSHQPNMLIGAGFNSFWSGESLREIWKTVPGVVQAHNGYLDTYLNGGILGVAFLLAWLWSTARRIAKSIMADADFASMRMAFLCIIVIYDWSEAAFNKTGLLWLVLLLVAMNPPGGYRVPLEIPASGSEEEEAEVGLAVSAPYQSGFGA